MREARRTGWGAGVAVAAVSLALGCAAVAPLRPEAVLRGEIAYRERMALPPGAIARIALVELRGAAPGRVLDELSADAPRSGHVPFELRYDPGDVEPGRRYGVDAVITVGERPWFATDPVAEVALGGDAPVTVLLRRVH